MTSTIYPPKPRTAEQCEALQARYEQLVDAMQQAAEWAECAGDTDVFAILDTAAERLRELWRPA